MTHACHHPFTEDEAVVRTQALKEGDVVLVLAPLSSRAGMKQGSHLGMVAAHFQTEGSRAVPRPILECHLGYPLPHCEDREPGTETSGGEAMSVSHPDRKKLLCTEAQRAGEGWHQWPAMGSITLGPRRHVYCPSLPWGSNLGIRRKTGFHSAVKSTPPPFPGEHSPNTSFTS